MCRAIQVSAETAKSPFGGNTAATRALTPDRPDTFIQPGTRDQSSEVTQVLGKIRDVLYVLVPYMTGQAMSQPGLGVPDSQPASQPPGRPWLPNPEKPNHRLCFNCLTRPGGAQWRWQVKQLPQAVTVISLQSLTRWLQGYCSRLQVGHKFPRHLTWNFQAISTLIAPHTSFLGAFVTPTFYST